MISVLDKGFVELQDIMGNDLAIVNAARVSYLGESKGKEQDKKLLFYLIEHGHLTPFEQVIFKFRIYAPVIVWWQLVRHRTGRYNLQSGRYTELDYFYIPDEWRLQSKDNKQGSEGTLDKKDSDYLSEQMRNVFFNCLYWYEKALEMGVAREQARLFLPGFAAYYKGIVQFDARNLMHFLKLRLHPHAQHEIREYAKAMYALFERMLPWTAEAFLKKELK